MRQVRMPGCPAASAVPRVSSRCPGAQYHLCCIVRAPEELCSRWALRHVSIDTRLGRPLTSHRTGRHRLQCDHERSFGQKEVRLSHCRCSFPNAVIVSHAGNKENAVTQSVRISAPITPTSRSRSGIPPTTDSQLGWAVRPYRAEVGKTAL